MSAHELAHNLGLPDAYRLNGGSVEIIERQASGDAITSLMSSRGVTQLSDNQRRLLAIALDAPNAGLGRSTAAQQAGSPQPGTADLIRVMTASDIDTVILYLYKLTQGEPWSNAPPEDGSASDAGGPGENDTTGQNLPAPSGTAVQSSTNGATFGDAAGAFHRLTDAAGWSRGGDVQVSGERATLVETAGTHSRLSQVFLINPSDRFLTFTMTDGLLRVNGLSGPSDAFEAALLDANTGLPLLGDDAGRVGLSRSDALLNLQTDGTERLASGVRKVTNADGSATYYLDLPAALAESCPPPFTDDKAPVEQLLHGLILRYLVGG